MFFFIIDQHSSTKKGYLFLLLQCLLIIPVFLLMIYAFKIPDLLIALLPQNTDNPSLTILQAIHLSFWCLLGVTGLIVGFMVISNWLIIRKMDREDLCSLKLPKIMAFLLTICSVGLSFSVFNLEKLPRFINNIQQDIKQITTNHLTEANITFDKYSKLDKGMISGPFYANTSHLIDSYIAAVQQGNSTETLVIIIPKTDQTVINEITPSVGETYHISYTKNFKMVVKLTKVNHL